MTRLSLGRGIVLHTAVLGLALTNPSTGLASAHYVGFVEHVNGTPITLQIGFRQDQPYELGSAITGALTLQCRGKGGSITRHLAAIPSHTLGARTIRRRRFSMTITRERGGLLPHVLERQHIEGWVGRERAHGVLRFDAQGGRCSTGRLRWDATRGR